MSDKEKIVLFVDDEVYILNALKRLLRNENYTITTATGGRQGLSLLEQQQAQLVISDQRMPEMTGFEFLQKVKELYPDTVRVMLSGYADFDVMVKGINMGEIYRFLAKPWNDEELKAVIRQSLAHYDLLQQNRKLTERLRLKNEELQRLNNTLEELIDQRTQSLQLSQEILERLPVPVVGISQDGLIVLANEAVRNTLPDPCQINIGAQVQEIFPREVVDIVRLCLENGKPEKRTGFQCHGRSFRLNIEPLRGTEPIRGCILTLEAIENEQ